MDWIVIKTLLSLAAVLVLMVGVVVLMKRFVHSGSASPTNAVDMRVIGTMQLQPKRSVSVLKVMNTILIVGITEDGMRTLGTIEDEKSVNEIDCKLAEQSSPVKWFSRKGAPSQSVSFAEALGMQLKKVVTKAS